MFKQETIPRHVLRSSEDLKQRLETTTMSSYILYNTPTGFIDNAKCRFLFFLVTCNWKHLPVSNQRYSSIEIAIKDYCYQKDRASACRFRLDGNETSKILTA